MMRKVRLSDVGGKKSAPLFGSDLRMVANLAVRLFNVFFLGRVVLTFSGNAACKSVKCELFKAQQCLESIYGVE